MSLRATGAFWAAAAFALSSCGGGAAAPAKQRRAGVGVNLGAGIPASLAAGVRQIGAGPRFQPAVSGPVTGRCEPRLGRRLAAHIEIFGANQVVLLAAGVGTKAPREFTKVGLAGARCFGDVVTVDPTGVVYFRPGTKPTLGTVFKAWGQPLSETNVASFRGGRARAYVDGESWHGAASALPLTAGAEIVVEIGPRVPPHRQYAFPQPPSPRMA